jgi:hypothetical protein
MVVCIFIIFTSLLFLSSTCIDDSPSQSGKIHTKTNRVMVGLLTDTVLPKNRVHQIVIYIGLSTWDGKKAGGALNL